MAFVNAEIVDIIVPRGIENRVAIDMVVKHIQRTLKEKSRRHQEELKRLGKQVEDEPLSANVLLLKETPQILGMNTIIQNPTTNDVDFIFYFDRMATLLIERWKRQQFSQNLSADILIGLWITSPSKLAKSKHHKGAFIKGFDSLEALARWSFSGPEAASKRALNE